MVKSPFYALKIVIGCVVGGGGSHPVTTAPRVSAILL